jgi:hypothetical protein
VVTTPALLSEQGEVDRGPQTFVVPAYIRPTYLPDKPLLNIESIRKRPILTTITAGIVCLWPEG